ncbi:unnamed protein product [Owenia fusiformis]|uniref:Uncharacterized protein n=1 Tax=Owenia fusiformis TaxID=6347 RepID=A0A8S4NRD6_OWEFU|nr:unnamed protein product [Owenia fusiformis]
MGVSITCSLVILAVCCVATYSIGEECCSRCCNQCHAGCNSKAEKSPVKTTYIRWGRTSCPDGAAIVYADKFRAATLCGIQYNPYSINVYPANASCNSNAEKSHVKTTYIRWGRTSCPDGAAIVYTGIAGGSSHVETGGGSNYQCLPTNPQWGRYTSAKSKYSALMYGAEYQFETASGHPNPFDGDNAPTPGDRESLYESDVPCAVCSVPRSTSIMIPAWKTCPDAWHFEYTGYLVSEYAKHGGRRTFECMDAAPEGVPGSGANKNGALFYAVEASCGSLPCPNYKDGAELTCVVCTS